MKTIVVVLLVATTFLSQNVNADSDSGKYDSQGRLITYQYPDGTKESYAYDSQGRMYRFVDRAGGVTTFQYTSGGSVVTVLPDGTTQTNGK